MGIEVPAVGEVEAIEKKTVATETTVISSATFNFNTTSCLAVVEFGTGTGEQFVSKAKECWILSGTFYATAVSAPPVGNSSAEVIYAGVGAVVKSIQETEGLKQSLIESGELAVVSPQTALQIFM